MIKKFIEIEGDGTLCEFKKESTLLEVLNNNDIYLDQSCEGMGTCGTCRIWVLEPKELPERNEIEQERAEALAFKPHERLSCQLAPIDKMKIKIPNSCD